MSFRSLLYRDPFSELSGSDPFDPMDPANYPTDDDRTAARQAADQTVAFNAADVEDNAETIAEGPTEPRQPLPIPSAPMASNDPEFRPPHAGQGDGSGEEAYDWRRMLSSLFGGSEGVSQLDRQRLAEASQRMQQKQAGERSRLGAAQEKRAQGRYEMDRDAALATKQEKAAKDKGARDLAAERIASAAARIQDEKLKAHALRAVELLRAPDSVATAQVAQEIARQFGADISDHLRGERQDRAQDEKAAQNDERNKQAWAKIGAIGARGERGPSERVKAQQAKNQEKLDTEIENAQWAQDMLLEVRNLKGSVDTGPVAGRAQDFAQEYLGLSTEEFDKMKQRLQMVANRIIKELSGSAVTGNEWMRMQDELASIKNNDGNFLTKLAGMIELTEAIKQKAINRYARGEAGAPAQPTNTAKRVTAQTPSVLPGETPPPDATPKPGASAKIAAIEKVLRDEPNHPQAEALKSKLAKLKGGAGAQ